MVNYYPPDIFIIKYKNSDGLKGVKIPCELDNTSFGVTPCTLMTRYQNLFCLPTYQVEVWNKQIHTEVIARVGTTHLNLNVEALPQGRQRGGI